MNAEKWVKDFKEYINGLTLLREDYNAIMEYINDARELPREQNAIPVDTKVIGSFNGDIEVFCCRNCRTALDPVFNYCPHCGRKIKWNENGE